MPPLDRQIPPEEVTPVEEPPSPDQAMPGPDVAGDDLKMGTVQASPEEQEMADRFVLRAWEMIYDDNVFPQVMEMLKGGAGQGAEGGDGGEGDPVRGLALATEMVVAKVANAADENGASVPPDVMHFAAGEILEELAEVSRRAKIKDYSKDSNALESAWFQALDMFRERLAQVGEIDQEAAQRGLDTLQRADRDGTLEKVMRDLADADRAGPAGGQEPPPESSRQKPRGFAAAMGGA